MQSQPESLAELLHFAPVAPGIFQAAGVRAWLPRVFGGQLLAQGLWAASRTLGAAECYALHAQFLSGAEPSQPIDYEVQPLRAGRSLATCSIVAKQRGMTRLAMQASFEREPSVGREFQEPMPDTPPPESFPDEAARTAALLERLPATYHEHLLRRWPIEWITVDEYFPHTGKTPPRQIRTWMRARDPLGDDPNRHRATLAYASDMVIADPAMNAVGLEYDMPSLQIASLDHAMWFHRPVRADDWVLFACDSPSVAAGRGLNRGVIYDRSGRLIASVAQEILVRERDTKST